MQFLSTRFRARRPTPWFAVALFALAAAALSTISPPPAMAGEFTIASCQCER